VQLTFYRFSGIIGLVLKYITPLTIAPAVAMVGLALFDVAAHIAAKHWGVAIG
jgi:nucleobase transporter 1/2